jgi:FixJ family two-component response regulator
MPGSPQSIIIIDDDRSVCTSLSRLLTVNGFNTLAFNSAEALNESAQAATGRCFVIDINLPGASGFDLARSLLKRESRRIGLIFITAHDRQEYRSEATALGALAYLPKPFAGENLLTAVRAALYASNSSTQPN